MEILYSLRLGSELDCKYGPDLKIKHFFYVKEEKSLKIYGRKKKNQQSKRNPVGLSGVRFHSITNKNTGFFPK